mmetsp:Transcript_83711/g.237451  ORF Transcript_83711/g.237451 Transcript_83711/m.237451 type:complete len:210 (+) Transcript_83711:2-631(+)
MKRTRKNTATCTNGVEFCGNYASFVLFVSHRQLESKHALGDWWRCRRTYWNMPPVALAYAGPTPPSPSNGTTSASHSTSFTFGSSASFRNSSQHCSRVDSNFTATRWNVFMSVMSTPLSRLVSSLTTAWTACTDASLSLSGVTMREHVSIVSGMSRGHGGSSLLRTCNADMKSASASSSGAACKCVAPARVQTQSRSNARAAIADSAWI